MTRGRVGPSRAAGEPSGANGRSHLPLPDPQEDGLAVEGPEPELTADDASLRPFARALLALAEQLVREGTA